MGRSWEVEDVGDPIPDGYGRAARGAVYTTFPPTIVYNALAPRIESAGTVMMSRESTVMSAY